MDEESSQNTSNQSQIVEIFKINLYYDTCSKFSLTEIFPWQHLEKLFVHTVSFLLFIETWLYGVVFYFMQMCNKVIQPASLVVVFETLLSSAATTVDEEKGNPSWQACADFYITCILSCLPWGGAELVEVMLFL